MSDHDALLSEARDLLQRIDTTVLDRELEERS